MRWSKLKGLVESHFAPSVIGRVELRSTRYRSAHDDEGRGWITIDKAEIWDMCTFKYWKAIHGLRETVKEMVALTGLSTMEIAEQKLENIGILSQEKFYRSLKEYCDLSIEDALASSNVLIASLAMLDRRVGKKKLRLLAQRVNAHPMTQRFYEFRRRAEGLDVAL